MSRMNNLLIHFGGLVAGDDFNDWQDQFLQLPESKYDVNLDDHQRHWKLNKTALPCSLQNMQNIVRQHEADVAEMRQCVIAEMRQSFFWDYEEINIQDNVVAELHPCYVNNFAKWLMALVRVMTAARDPRMDQPQDCQGRYVVHENKKRPTTILYIVIEEQNFNEDYSVLHISLQNKIKCPFVADAVFNTIKVANEGGKNPSKEEIMQFTGFTFNAVHNALVEISHHKCLVEPVESKQGTSYKIVQQGQKMDGEAVFKRAKNNVERRALLEAESDVYRVKQMLRCLVGGFQSPSSNVPLNLKVIFGEDGWQHTKVPEAVRLLSNEMGDRWSYAGD